MNGLNGFRLRETFVSVQGESTRAGRVCFFIRFAGCNLNCAYCDTLRARDVDDGEETSLNRLLQLAVESGVNLVELTGGEPLLQPGLDELCRALLEKDFEVLVETNGSLPIGGLPIGVVRIVDCKTPSSGEEGRTLFENFDLLTSKDEVKFVIGDENDYRFSLKVIGERRLLEKTANLLFSPLWGRLDSGKLAEWMIRDASPARLQPQLHKIIGCE